ncbi:hypothetical protein [Burkholderia cenocepacia]|jgi:sRNA-binding protein|uniref:hypothetical protein n=1 Tax=Burkholderia cenocepacia TaxID=95486 RepID=UPI0008464724|nr:hypothetical protein [Burkholderia cenocepacia]
MHDGQWQTALNRALVDHARVEAERDAWQVTNSSQERSAQAREALASLTADRTKPTKLAAQPAEAPDFASEGCVFAKSHNS